MSLLTSALAALVNQGQAALETDRAPGALGNRHPSIAPYETLQCRDTLVAVACGNDGQFARLATVLGAPELAVQPEFASNASRVGHREQLVEQLEKLLAHDDAASWVARLAAAEVPAGTVGTILDGLQLADDLGLEPTVSVGDGHRPQVRHPVRWNTYRTATATPPPALGEHDAAVRAWLTDPADPRCDLQPSTTEVTS